MSIRVTCPGCHARFNVSDQFAGKSGPCPKCKKTIQIPDKAEEVVVHAPENFGPADSQGRSVLKPIFRQEKRVSTVQIFGIGLFVVLGIAIAAVLRFSIPDPANFPLPILVVGAVLMAPPLSWVAYEFLHNRELEAFAGTDLWLRILISSGVFAVLWVVFPVILYAVNADDYSLVYSSIAIVLMLVAGGAVAMLAFDYDYLLGCVHFGLYLLTTLLLRLLAGLEFIPMGPDSL